MGRFKQKKRIEINILFIFCFVNRIDNKTAAFYIKLLFFFYLKVSFEAPLWQLSTGLPPLSLVSAVFQN